MDSKLVAVLATATVAGASLANLAWERDPAPRTDPVAGFEVLRSSPDEGVDGQTTQDLASTGSFSDLDSGSPYAERVSTILEVARPNLVRRQIRGISDDPIVLDEMNVASSQAGYQATIYHGIPDAFATEHDEAGFPTVATSAGKAWFSVTGGNTISVALINNNTGGAVRTRYYDPTGKNLPSVAEVANKAIALSNDQIILEEIK